MTREYSFSSIPEDTRTLMEGAGRRLEAIECVLSMQTFLVITYHVDVRDRPSFKTPPGVIKFSKKEHAIPDSGHIKLGLSRYYRECKVDTAGVADAEEGRLVQRGSLSEFHKKNDLASQPGFEPVSAEVTWARSDFLIFCTSVTPEGRGIGALATQFPDYDCAISIPDPSAFAMQLGKDVGRQFDMENVRLNGIDWLRRTYLTQAEITPQGHLPKRGLDAVFSVFHGPVTYCDPPEEIINRFPLGRRGDLAPFVKRCEFEGQREYRFVVEFMGEPKEMEFRMEITDELRSLSYLHPELCQV